MVEKDFRSVNRLILNDVGKNACLFMVWSGKSEVAMNLRAIFPRF